MWLPIHSVTSRPSSNVDDGWRLQMTTLLSFFSTAPCFVTSPSAECSYSHSTLLCHPSIVFWVFLGDVNHLYCPPTLSVSAKFPALPLVTCPKYCSFIRANFPINPLSRPISSNIDILVRCSFQEIPSIFLQHHISKDSILFLSDFFNVYPSTPYWNTAQTIDFITDCQRRRDVFVLPDGSQFNCLLMFSSIIYFPRDRFSLHIGWIVLVRCCFLLVINYKLKVVLGSSLVCWNLNTYM